MYLLQTMHKNNILICFLFLIHFTARTQESAIYRDDQETYKNALHFYEQKMYFKALESFDKVVQNHEHFSDKNIPEYILDAEIHAALSALYIKQKDALKRVDNFIEKNEPTAISNRAKLAVGNYYYDQRNYSKSITYLSLINNKDLSKKEIIAKNFKLGYSYFVKKKFDLAEPLFSEITDEKKSSYFYPSNYYYGLIRFFEADHEEAIKSFKIVEHSSKYKLIVPCYICQIYFAKKEYALLVDYGSKYVKDENLKERAQIAQLVGQAHFEMGDYTKALPYLEDYIQNSSKVSKEALYQLGFTQYKVGQYEAAIQNFKYLNGLDNKMGQNALYNLADCLLKTKDKKAARLAFQNASKMDFDEKIQQDALINFAKLSFELGFDNDAILNLQDINMDSPYYNEAQNLLTEIFINTRNYDVALDYLRKMKNKTPKMQETHQKIAYLNGVQHYNINDLVKAIQLFQESNQIGLNQEIKALAHFWMAEALYKKNAYDKSINSYLEFNLLAKAVNQLPANSSIGVSNYGIGYAYLKMEDYANASKAFHSSVNFIKNNLDNINDIYVTNFVYPDALLRAGDCFLQQRKYEKSTGFYNIVVNKDYPMADYAMYQLSLVYNIQDNYQKQISLLDQLIQNYPNSLYADDAVFAKGNSYLIQDMKVEATQSYLSLIQNYEKSELYIYALLKLGLIAYAQDEDEAALDYYKAAYRHNPQSEAGSDALAAIREIYVNDGNVNGYFNFLNSVGGYQMDELEKDSLMFISANMKFQEGQWQGAIDGFSAYLNKYPNGIHHMKARFYRAESLFDLKKYTDAIVDYAFLSEDGNPSFAETSNNRAANISYYILQNFEEACKYYLRLEKVASNPDLLYESQQYGMRSAYYAQSFDTLQNVCLRFMQNERATPSDFAEANYFLGKAYLIQNKFNQALAAFNKNIELSSEDAYSAESRYWRAYITYNNRELDKAMDLCFQNNKEIPNHPYWLVKSFILLADIYAEKDNLFQAKATLQSIIDNYEGDQKLIDEAKQKLELVIQAEQNKTKLKREIPDAELEMLEDNN